VSQYDAFLGRLVSALLRQKPELLKSSDRVFTFSQLCDFNSLEEARELVLEKEIETLLRKSHAEQFDWLEKKFDINLHADLPVWPLFIEVTERRNLFVHSNGVVSSQYLRACREHKVELKENVKQGTELRVSPKYFSLAYAAIYEIGMKLAQVLWRKLNPSEIKDADKILTDFSFELIEDERYDLAKTMLDFACRAPMKYFDERNRLVFLVNKAQAYKWSGDLAAAEQIVNGQDWSATGDAFRLAAAVLKDQYETAATLMRKIGDSGYPHKEHYKTWPLFKQFRKTKEFEGAFQEIFGELPSQSEVLEKSKIGKAKKNGPKAQLPPSDKSVQ
jgi:hypothetical protein